MKKLFLVVLTLVTLVMVGCDDCKPSGSGWDVDRHSNGWEVWGQGRLASLTTQLLDPTCPHTVKEDCISCPKVSCFTFDNGREVYLRLIRNPGTVIEGQTGKLYRKGTNSRDSKSWFQWVPDLNVPIVPTEADGEIKTHPKIHKHKVEESDLIKYGDIPKATYDKEKPVKRYNWKSYPDVRPPRFQTMLVRLEDGVIMTAYINNINEWKSETNRKEKDGGDSITNVASWKELDLN